MKKNLFLIVALIALMCSCNSNKFKVSGVVEGAGDTTTLYLETSANGIWYLVDSVVTSNDKFSLSGDAIEYPNIYRLVHGEDAIYFPIDSIDQIEINTTLKGFANDYTLSGSDNAVRLMKYDKQLSKFAKAGDTSSEAFKKWKTDLSREMIKDGSNIVSYYMINKFVGDQPLFDPEDKQDFKIIGAITTAFSNFKPNDPRTNYLVETFKEKLRIRKLSSNAHRDTIVASTTGVLDFKLIDSKGKTQSLKDVCSQGKVVVLNFTMTDMEVTPGLNTKFNEVYQKYKASGLEIYQVCYDSDEATWRQAITKLPWIVTRDPDGAKTAMMYNVEQIPMTYIINRHGEIVQRVEINEIADNKLGEIIQKYM